MTQEQKLKQEATGFAEWLEVTQDLKYYPPYGWCQPGGSNGWHYTTEELYNKFKEWLDESFQSHGQQPIPQDINIEEEAEKFANRPEFKSILLKLDTVGVPREGILAVMEAAFNAGAQLLLPQLQECKEQLSQAKEEIERLHAQINLYIKTISDLTAGGIEDQKEIESLKQENEKWKSEAIKMQNMALEAVVRNFKP